MEELLNKLIKKWWKPFKIKSDNMWLYCLKDNKIVISYYDFDTEWECNHEDKWCDLRQLTSKESWLWQFVCENWMVKELKEEKLIEIYDNLRWRTETVYDDEKYEYRIIESALIDEDKLEDFILSNVKINE